MKSDTPDYPLRMAFQAEANRPAYLQQITPQGLPQYVQKVRELAERAASQYVGREAEALLGNLAQPVYQNLATNWANQYMRWENELGQHCNNLNPQVLTLTRLVLNQPESPMWQPNVVLCAFKSKDSTFALQALVVHGLAACNLRITRDGLGKCRLFNTQHLVDLPEVLTFRCFNTLDVDVRLQNALADQEAFKLFAECLVRDCYDDIYEALGLEALGLLKREQITDWLSVLDRFIRQLTPERRRVVERTIQSKERLSADQIAAHLPSGDENALLLARAIREVLNLQENAQE